MIHYIYKNRLRGIVDMEEQIKALDCKLIIYDRKNSDKEIHVYCERIYEDRQVHQTTMRTVKDIPFNGKKVIIHLKVKRFKNTFDKTSNKKTITESFDFLNDTGRRTKRLEESLYDLTKNQSFSASSEYANKFIASISRYNLVRMVLKKRNSRL